MRSSLRAVALGLAVALLCVPAAFAKGSAGHGGGKPSWAGGGGGQGHAYGSGHEHGKPSWAGQGKAHGKSHEKVKHESTHQQAEPEDEDAGGDEELNLDDLNPAWACFTLEAMMDENDAGAEADGAEAEEVSSFDAEFGTNENKRNSHGMCVSVAAQGEDVSAAQDEAERDACEAPEDDATDATSEDGAEEASDDTAVDKSSGAEDEATSAEDEATSDEDQASQDEAESSDEECAQDDGSADEPSADEGDEAGDDQGEGGDEADQGDDAETAAFARALVRYVHL